MPGTILLDDLRDSVGDQLKQYANQLGQAGQQAVQSVQAAVQPVTSGPDPNQILQELQQHAASVVQPVVQQAAQALQVLGGAGQAAGGALTQLGQTRDQVAQQLQQHVDTITQQAQQGLQTLAQPPMLGAPAQPDTATIAPPPDRSMSLQDFARAAAQRAGIDPSIFVAQIQQESGFNPTAKSGAGALGIAQFMPQTAQGMNVDPTDPYAALEAAARLDAQNLKKYAGDYAKTLAAYNAGGGAVDQYGGVPPFQETQKYVSTILGNAKQALGGAVESAGRAVPGPVGQAIQGAGRDISQFGDPQLTSDEAYAACGPAAAVRFAEKFGRNPTLREATDLAKSVGWTSGGGMAGIQSEQKLMTNLGVDTKLVGRDWQAFAREAQTGNPVTISTPGHYFFADGYNAESGAFHVGRSGLDLKNGAEWMTPAQMENLMGTAQGALFANNPTVPTRGSTTSSNEPIAIGAPPPARQPLSADQTIAQSQAPTPIQSAADVLGGAAGAVGGAVGQAASALGTAAQNVLQGAQAANQRQPGTEALNAVGQVARDLGQAAQSANQLQPGTAAVQAATPVLGGLASDLGAGAQQLGGAVAGAYGLNKTERERQEFQQRQLEEVQRLIDEQNRTAQQPMTAQSLGSNLLSIFTGATPAMGVTWDDYRAQQDAKNQWIEQNNPLRDAGPGGIVGALTSSIAQQLTDPLMVATFGPTLGAARTAGLGAGEAVTSAAASRLSPAATRFLSTVAERVTTGGIVNGLQQALFEAEKPDATPQAVGQALLSGAALGAGIDLAAPAVATVVRRIGQSVIDRAAEIRPGDLADALRTRQRAEGINPFNPPARPEPAPATEPGRVARPELASQEAAPLSEPNAPVRTAAADMRARWLQDQPVVPTSDPRPATGEVQFGGPNVKRVTQASLDEITPQDATLYHETSVPSAGALLERIESGPRNHDPIFTSDNRDLALSQGGKGVMLEFDPAKANGGVAPQKPGLGFTSATSGGQEYTVSKTLPGAVKAIVVQTQQQADQLAKSSRISRRFDFAAAEQTPDGIRIPYRERVTAPEVPAAATGTTPGTPSTGPSQLQQATGAGTGPREAPLATTPPIPGERVPELPTRPMPAGVEPIKLTPTEETARLRLEDFPEDLRPTIQQAAEGADFARQQRRGVIPDAVSEQMAQRYADDTTLSQLIRSSPAGTAFNEEQIRAVRNATGAQAAAVNDAAAAIARGDDSSGAIARFALEAEKLDRLVQVAEGARAEAGRSMRAFRDAPRLQNLAPNDAVAQLTKMVGGDRQKLLDAIGEYQTLVGSGAGPVQMANFWASVKNPPPGPGDWFKLIRYNSMLSGPRTFEVNATSNSLELPWRFARDVMASTVRGRPGEVAVEASGAWSGLDQANRAFLDTLFQGITQEAAARGELPMGMANQVQNPIARGIARGLEMATRPLAAADEWARAIAYNMSVGRLAAVKASEEGLRGQAWTDRVSDILSHKQTAPQLMQQADGMANRMTFHGDMGNIGQGLQAFTQRTGVLGNLILPFLRTTYQITSRGIERSPLGLVGTGIDVARGAYGPATRSNLREALAGRGEMPKGVTPLGERLGDNLMGSAIFLGLYSQALDGNISGAGPDEPGKRSLLQSEGWQPYSVRVGNRWVSYANWGPAAVPFAMAAAATETQRYGKPGMQPGELVLDGMRRTAQIAQEQTYLQAIGSAWKGITDPAAYGSQFVNNTLTSLLPFGSAINTLAAAFDPNARRVDRFNALDALQSRLPSGTPLIGGREDVPIAQDVLGRPAPNLTYGAGAVNPLRVSEIKHDPVLTELDAVGIAPPGPPSTLSRRGVQLRLNPDEQRQVQSAAGALIDQRIGEEIGLSSYQQLEPKARARVLQAIIDRARTQAENTWLSSLSEEEYQQRKAQSEQRKELVPVGGR